MEHKDILAALGYYREVAARMGVHHSTVSRWKTEGIPPEYWPRVVRMARARKVRGITLEVIEAGSPVWGERGKERQADPVS
jgi:hypothetical protein